jgi:glycosyltransferase involved in cell wall biosynthesis
MNLLFDFKAAPKSGGIARDAHYIQRVFSEEIQKGILTETKKRYLIGKLNKKYLTFRGLFKRGTKANLKGADVFVEFQFSGFRRSNDDYWHVIRVHDLFPLTNPEWFKRTSVLVFKKSFESALESEKTIFICNSRATMMNLLNVAPEVKRRSFVIYCKPCLPSSSSFAFCGCDGCKFLSIRGENPYILMVGTIEPRKNYSLILELQAKRKINTSLVVIGRPGWKSRKVQRELKNSEAIAWISGCCDAALTSFYARASAFLSLSFDEGFNLPAGEALLSGTRLILPRSSIYDELYGDFYNSFSEVDELVGLLNNAASGHLRPPSQMIDYDEHNKGEMKRIMKLISATNSN